MPPGSVDELARALVRVLGDRETARRWGEASRQRVRREFSAERMVQRYEALFEELLAQGGRVSRLRSR